jgi:hypothetical protein
VNGLHRCDAARQLYCSILNIKMGTRQALFLLAAFAFSVGLVSTDYVVTGLGPGPANIAPGHCPYVFQDDNIRYAKGFCLTGEHTSSIVLTCF